MGWLFLISGYLNSITCLFILSFVSRYKFTRVKQTNLKSNISNNIKNDDTLQNILVNSTIIKDTIKPSFILHLRKHTKKQEEIIVINRDISVEYKNM